MLAVRTLTAVLIACALSLLPPSGPASAGGPTSVLLSVPGEGRTASLYYSHADYESLADLVGVNGSTGTVDRSGRSHESGTAVTLTWLIHDVEPWRLDRIYLTGDGAPWIATQVMRDTGTIWDSAVVWHQPAAGKELVLLLDRLGVGQVARAAGDFDGVAGAPVDPVEPAVEETAPVASQSAREASAFEGAWWGLGGLAAGLLLAAAWVRSRSTREDDWGPDGEPADEDGVKDWLAPAART